MDTTNFKIVNYNITIALSPNKVDADLMNTIKNAIQMNLEKKETNLGIFGNVIKINKIKIDPIQVENGFSRFMVDTDIELFTPQEKIIIDTVIDSVTASGYYVVYGSLKVFVCDEMRSLKNKIERKIGDFVKVKITRCKFNEENHWIVLGKSEKI